MNFKINICLTEKDYLDYNVFWMLKSPYGKKQMTSFRIIIAIGLVAAFLISFFAGGFSREAFVGSVPYLIALAVVQIIFNQFFIWAFKIQLRAMKKRGKMGYSPSSEMEFFNDCFTEITVENKIEQKYTAIERISIIGDETIYLHINNVMAYIIPVSCFESKEQYGEFLNFIRTKCQSIDTY